MSSSDALALDDGRVVLGDDDLAGPAQQVERDVLELHADLVGDDLAAGEDRHVLEHRLAAVAEPGGLDGDGGERAAELVDHERGQGLALDVLGDDQQRLAGLHELLEHRQQVLHARDLLADEQDVGVLEDGLHPLRVGDEVRRDVALVELHPLDELELDAERLALLDGDDAVLADLLERLGDRRRRSLGSAAEMAATWAMSSLPSTSRACLPMCSTAAATAFSMPRFRAIGLAPAATLRMPSWTMARASTVAVVVPSPATSLVLVATSLASWAPMFSNGSSSSISLAIVTPSFVMVGAPHFLSSTTLRPFGPSVMAHGVGELVHAGLEAAPGFLVELQSSSLP